MSPRTFGRRASRSPQTARAATARSLPDAAVRALFEPADTRAEAEQAPAAPVVDEELRAWKKERRRGLAMRIPWRQLSLFASLSFGIASFVLPDRINDAVNWILYLLAAASLYVWFSGRKPRHTEEKSAGATQGAGFGVQ